MSVSEYCPFTECNILQVPIQTLLVEMIHVWITSSPAAVESTEMSGNDGVHCSDVDRLLAVALSYQMMQRDLLETVVSLSVGQFTPSLVSHQVTGHREVFVFDGLTADTDEMST
jgi:hypothetical protein